MGIWRGLGGHTYKNVGKMPNSWTDRHQSWHKYAYSSGNGHELNKNNPLIPEGHGGWYGASINKSGKASKPLERSGPNLAHVYRFTREWTYAKQIYPSSPKGHLDGVRGHKLINVGNMPNSCTDRDQIWHTYTYSSGNGNRLNN